MAEKQEIVGTFAARAVEAKWSKTKAGLPQIAVQLEVTAKGSEEFGKQYTWYGSFSDSKMGEATVAERTIQSLMFMGARMRDDNPADLEGITDREVNLVITLDEGLDGKVRKQASFINPRGLNIREELSAEEVKSVSANLKGLVSSVRKNAKSSNGENPGGLPTKDGKPIF